MRVLVAEDDDVSRRTLEKMLWKWGYEVALARDGEDARRILDESAPPSLLILDWIMPRMSGIDLCRELRRQEHPIRPYVILLTGKNEKRDIVEGFEAGADDYVTKPFDSDELKARVRAGERIVNLLIGSAAAVDALRKQARHDSLTGIRNRAAILEELNRAFALAPRTGRPVAVAIADIDHFKKINDSFGHRVGDKALVEAVSRMVSVVRSYEVVGRHGGDEFLIVLSDCDLSQAAATAERVRLALCTQEFEIRGSAIPVTASLGVASTFQMPHPSGGLLIELADRAMYLAKRAGRNAVRTACDLTDQDSLMGRASAQAAHD